MVEITRDHGCHYSQPPDRNEKDMAVWDAYAEQNGCRAFEDPRRNPRMLVNPITHIITTCLPFYPWGSFESGDLASAMMHPNDFWIAFKESGAGIYPDPGCSDNIWDEMKVILHRMGVHETLNHTPIEHWKADHKRLNEIYSGWKQWGCP